MKELLAEKNIDIYFHSETKVCVFNVCCWRWSQLGLCDSVYFPAVRTDLIYAVRFASLVIPALCLR